MKKPEGIQDEWLEDPWRLCLHEVLRRLRRTLDRAAAIARSQGHVWTPAAIFALAQAAPFTSFSRLGALACLLALAGACATTDAARRPSTPADWRAENQPPLGEEEARDLAEGPSLPRAIELGAARNPAVEAARQRWLAQIHLEPQAATPPDPMVEIGYELRAPVPRVGRAEWGVELEQPLPWPQKLWAQARAAAASARVAQLQYEVAMRDLVIDIKDACYELQYLDRAIPVVDGTEALLRNHAILAYSELRVGRTQLNEAFRAESEAAQLTYERLLLTERREAQAEALRALLNLPPGTPIGPVRQAPVYPVSRDLEALYARAENHAQSLRMQGLETQLAAYQTFLARLARIPDITLGGTYTDMGRTRTPREPVTIPMPPTTGPDDGMGGAATGTGGTGTPSSSTMAAAPEMKTRDPIMAMLSMNLPIYEWRNRALIRERRALEEAVRLDALGELNEVRAGVARAWFEVRVTERLLALYDDTLLPQAQAVMEQAEAFYRSDAASFANVIETTLAYRNFTLARLRAWTDHGQAIGRLERVLGTTAEDRYHDTAEAPAPPAGAEDP